MTEHNAEGKENVYDESSIDLLDECYKKASIRSELEQYAHLKAKFEGADEESILSVMKEKYQNELD